MEFSRRAQLDAALEAAERHTKLQKSLKKAIDTYNSQLSHLSGLYGEVDKLAKGKSLVSVSDFLIDMANSLISDAKNLVFNDTYLDRLKTFVPAGTNPEYPDVLLSLRVLQQVLERFDTMLTDEAVKQIDIESQLQTILGALRVAELDEEAYQQEEQENEDEGEEEEHNDEEDEEEEEEQEDENEEDEYEKASDESDEYVEYVRKLEVRKLLHERTLATSWFIGKGEDALFNFARLDKEGLPAYEPPSDGITFLKNEIHD